MNIIELSEKFPTEFKAVRHFERIRWGKVILCPYCNHDSVSAHDWQHRHRCYKCTKAFSVTVGTQLHHTRVPLKTWLYAFSIISDAKKGISSLQLQRQLNGLDYKTVHKISIKAKQLMAMETNQTDQLEGIVEIDETYIGGKPRRVFANSKGRKKFKPYEPELDAQIAELKKGGVNFRTGKKSVAKPDFESKTGRGTNNIPVVGIVQRNGDVVAEVMRGVTYGKLKEMVKEYVVENESTLVSDQAPFYKKMDSIIDHIAINHKKMYSYKGVNTNSIESFWAIVKRGIMGQYHHVSAKYLPDYIVEFVFKYNNRKIDDMFETLVINAMKPNEYR